MEGQCIEWVGDSTFRGHQCTRRAKVFVDGKGYCTQHSPEAVAKRRAEAQARDEQIWADKRAAREARLRRLEAAERLAQVTEEAINRMLFHEASQADRYNCDPTTCLKCRAKASLAAYRAQE